MLSEQIKARLSEVVTSATAAMESSPTAHLSPMMLHALSPDELATAASQGSIDAGETLAQTEAIQRHPGAEAVRRLQSAILGALVEGRPVSPEDLAARTGMPVPDVVEHLRHAAEFPGAELDDRGHALGLGLSLVATRHQVLLADRRQTLYAWCAPDALLLPGLVSQHAQVVSPCQATGQDVTIELRSGRVADVHPSGAVLSFMAVIDPGNIRGSGCDQQNFFVSADAAAGWLDEHAGGFVLPVAAAFPRRRLLRDARGRPCG